MVGPYESDEAALALSLTDPSQFSSVFEHRIDEIYRYLAQRVGPDLADELAAETFVQAFVGRRGYQPTRGSVRAWLYGIATNLVRRRRRQEQRRLIAYARLTVPDRTDAVHDAVLDRMDATATVNSALGRIDAEARDVVLLVAGAQLTYEETSAALGIPVGTVRSRYSRARTQLRKLIDADSDLIQKGGTVT